MTAIYDQCKRRFSALSMKNVSTVKTVPDYLSDGRFRHVLGVLDREPPWILRKLAPVLSSRVTIDEYVRDRLESLANSGPLVYAMKFRSIYDLHYLRIRFAELGLPVPCFAFGVSPSESGSLFKWAQVWTNRVTNPFHTLAHPEAVDENILKEILDRRGAGVLFLVDEKTSRTRYIHPDVDPLGRIRKLSLQAVGDEVSSRKLPEIQPCRASSVNDLFQ